jgi:[glutamine synthetase] adenylyltransferase / [glutamine synthetase]-adenylyl-L-tyrosine phosphorylase
VLSQAASHPGLIANIGNIALLEHAQAVGLLPAPLGRNAANAYRALRHIQHRARLNEEPTQVQRPALAAECDAVLALWACVFEGLTKRL